MGTDPQMDAAKEQIAALADELTYEGPLTPPDAYFICRLLEEYYNAEAAQGEGSKAAVDFAWDLAQSITEFIDENPQFDWIHAYFVVQSQINLIRHEHLEYETDRTHNPEPSPSHRGRFETCAAGETGTTLADSANELLDLTRTYIELEQPSESPLEKPYELGMFFRHLSKRYAHEFESDMPESRAKMDLIPLMRDYMEDETYSVGALLTGGRCVEEWLEERAKAAHHALVGAPTLQ